jgi:uncharacterized membrane protein YfcA
MQGAAVSEASNALPAWWTGASQGRFRTEYRAGAMPLDGAGIASWRAAMLLTIALGALIGVVLALTGAGGGVLAVPLLIFSLRLSVAEAAPVALLATALAGGTGALLGLRSATVRYRAAGLMAALGIAAAPVGIWLGLHIANGPLTAAFAAVLVYSSVRALLRAQARAAFPLDAASASAPRPAPPCAFDPVAGRLRWTPRCARALGFAGLASGVLAAMLGVGGGFVIVPALARVTDLDMRSITATSLAVVTLVSIGSLAAIWFAGAPIAWRIALPFAGGALAGLLTGRRVALGISAARLQQGYAVLCLCVAGLLLVHLGGA